jgi:uncharacterized protein DUF4440
MKNILIISGLILFGLLAINVNEAAAHPWTPSQKKVVNLEREYFKALEAQDQELMSSILHDNFVISSMQSASNPDLDKESFLSTMPEQIITWQEIEHVKVDINGNVAKSVVNISMMKTYGGQDHSGDYEVYSVWVREGGGWLLLNRRIKLLNQT